jgi:putative FmdB family regulatory protein
MPIYDYKCKSCDHEFEKNVKMAQYQDPQECPKCNTLADRFVNGAPSLGDPIRLGLQKPSEGFRDVLRSIHERTPGSQLKNNSSYI